jgi:hypothetical protein
MIPIASGVRVWLATGHTDMRRGMNSLSLQVQEVLQRDAHGGDLFVFRGKRGQLIKISVARPHRNVALQQAAREGPIHLAVSGRRRGGDFGFAARLYARGDRLETPAANLAATSGGITCDQVTHRQKWGVTGAANHDSLWS